MGLHVHVTSGMAKRIVPAKPGKAEAHLKDKNASTITIVKIV
tara:strand:- start:1693 stop:1818 length:126 start_codon:yes stop_codon:yes gene_type:complete